MDKFAKFAEAWARASVAAVYPYFLAHNASDHAHLPEEPMGDRLPQPRGPAVYGTESRVPYNGTGTTVIGTSTYYWPT